ncbi:hypothetical protein F5883DRAFT_591245 [Diaporthe sp. PMI_573]|nr:hypothetical protein F5883DRAFT_594281 [Diaporthaceae sp. PMI_573]KAH8743944.1 hypothetical protein F5883DRAFT_591245 [Diaporthaceae sp. PMI_573]
MTRRMNSLQGHTPVMFSNWLGSLNSSFWNATDVPGRVKKHPVEAFWAERFLGDQRKKAGLAENWFPFGGGASRCPGESLAKHTILCTVAEILKISDVELSDPVAKFPFGSHAFDKRVPILVRLRQIL